MWRQVSGGTTGSNSFPLRLEFAQARCEATGLGSGSLALSAASLPKVNQPVSLPEVAVGKPLHYSLEIHPTWMIKGSKQ
jgi:hypothetical protein